MRILVDECVEPRIRRLFAEHEIAMVHEQEWDTLDDGALLVGVVVVHVPKNQIADYEALLKELLRAVEQVRNGKVHHVGKPPFREPKN